MEIDQLRTFVGILEHGSFSRAAEAMHLTQSTVSFHLKALERATKTRLLDRNRGKVRLTASGRVLRRYASRILTLREEALAELRAEETGEAGQVNIAASTIPAEYLLPPILAAFRRGHPGVSVSIQISDSRRALAQLLEEACDLALVGARSADKSVVSVPFAEDEVILVGGAGNPFAPSGKLTGQGLKLVPLILREEGSGTRAAINKLLAQHGLTLGQPSGLIQTTGSTEAVKRYALEGLGLAFISRHAVVDELKSGKLEEVALPGTPVKRSFYLARLRSRTPPAAARALIDLIVE